MPLFHQSFTYEPDGDYALHITAKRYWTPAFDSHVHDPDALTLIFLHSTSFHKETWEPTLETLFLLAASKPGAAKIREAWAIDCPNHGASAELNEVAIGLPEYFHSFTCEKYAIAVHRFLSAGPAEGTKVNFASRKLLGVGHSLGGVAMSVLQNLEPLVAFQAIVLVEPMLSPDGPEHLYPLRTELIRGAYERRDVWPSRQSALDSLSRSSRTGLWDTRVLQAFVTHALRAHPGARFAVTPYDGVTLCCTREQEAAMYRDVDGPVKPVLDLNAACARMPVHIVFGALKDYMPGAVHDAIIASGSPRRFASIAEIKDAGHLVPQQAPNALAEVLYGILESHARGESAGGKSRL